MKKLFALIILLASTITMAQNLDIPIKEKIRRLNEQRTRLAKIHKELGKEVKSITKIKDNCVEINNLSKKVLEDNVKKIAGKGFLELMTSIGIAANPFSAGAQAGLKLWEQFIAEPILSDIGINYFEQNFSVKGIRDNMEQVINKDNDLFNDIYLLDNLKSYPLEYYKQDNRKLPDQYSRLKPFWEGLNMNNNKDIWHNTDFIEPSIRKTNIYIKISNDAIKSAFDLIDKISIDRRKLKDMIEAIDRKIIELGGQLDTWDYTPDEAPNNLQQPKNTNRAQAKNNNDRYDYMECINPGYVENKLNTRYNKHEVVAKRREDLKRYYENNYRFDTYIKANFLDEVYLGQKIKLENYKIEYANPHIKNPYGVYRYSHEVLIDGIKSSTPFSDLTNLSKGRPGKHSVTVVLNSCDDIIEYYEHKIMVKDPIFDATIYFKDPKSEVHPSIGVSFDPAIDHPSIDNPEGTLQKYYYKIFLDDKVEWTKERSTTTLHNQMEYYRPDRSKLTPGKHEVRIQLFDFHTFTFIDQYLHTFTVLEGGSNYQPIPIPKKTEEKSENYGQIKEETYDPDLEGKRVPVLRMQWANYDYVFGSGKVKIEGFYYWNYKKIMYTSEPILNYQEGATNVPGMVLTNTSGYHIYPTTGSSGVSSNYIITQMKGPEIKILHRLTACDFNFKINPDKTITISYRSSPAGQIKTITLL